MTGKAPMRQRHQRGQGALLRGEVLVAAMRLLDRSSAMDLSLRTIAREVGVAAPSLYSQFKGSTDLLDHVARECWRQLAQAMDDAERAAEASGPLDRLCARLSGYLRYALDRPSRYQLLFGVLVDTREKGTAPGPLRPIFAGLLQRVEAVPDRRVSGAGDDPVATTFQILSLVHGRLALSHLALHDPINSPDVIERFIHDTVARLLR